MKRNSDFELVETLWEHRMIKDAQERYEKSIEKKQLHDTRLGQKLLEEIAEAIQPEITRRQKQATTRILEGRKRLPWQTLLPLVLSPLKASLCVTASLMGQLTRRSRENEQPSYHSLCMGLATDFLQEIRFQKWAEDNPKFSTDFLKSHQKLVKTKVQHIRFARNLESLIELYLDPTSKAMEDSTKLSLGSVLLDCIYKGAPDLLSVSTQTNSQGTWGLQKIWWSDDFLTDVTNLHAAISVGSPLKRPMLVPPIDWDCQPDGRFTGGYYLIQQKLYRVSWHAHRFDPSDRALAALNAVQKTAWRVNQPVYDFLARMNHFGPQFPTLKPTRLNKEEWDLLDREGRQQVSQSYRDEFATYISQTSKAMSFERQMLQAKSLHGRPFWQPHAFDFRGRLYASNQMLTSMGDHFSKGLIEYHNGKALGAEGLEALLIHCANDYGYDKLPLKERRAKILDLLPQMTEALLDDEVALELLRLADSPMTFYAAMIEVVEALGMDDPTAYISHIPLAVDGTNNGLQLLSLLGKDPIGAKKTNCTNDERQDIYLEVGLAVRAQLVDVLKIADVSDPVYHAALAWEADVMDDKKVRAICKRSTMTKAYGCTREGIREQLVQDKFVNDIEIPAFFGDLPIMAGRHKLAGYLRDWIMVAHEESMVEAVKIMAYLRETSKLLAKNDYALSWVTPDNCEVQQDYRVVKDRLVRTFDNWQRRIKVQTPELSVSKSAAAASPNVVHSLDACMLRMVANRLTEHGIEDMSFIHDSYAVHACHLNILSKILREVAVEMFEGNWLQDTFHKGVVRLTEGSLGLPEVPEQGALDIRKEIPSARYFFS